MRVLALENSFNIYFLTTDNIGLIISWILIVIQQQNQKKSLIISLDSILKYDFQNGSLCITKRPFFLIFIDNIKDFDVTFYCLKRFLC